MGGRHRSGFLAYPGTCIVLRAVVIAPRNQGFASRFAPRKDGKVCYTRSIKPGTFCSLVVVMALPNCTRPSPACVAHPARTRRRHKVVGRPRVGVCRMLQDAAPLANACKSRGKAASIVAYLVAISLRVDRRELAPRGARRMRHDCMGTLVEACVSRLVP